MERIDVLSTAARLACVLSLCSPAALARPRAPGDTFGPTFPISTAADSQKNVAVAYNPSCDCFLVVWQDRRNGTDDDIWGCYVNGIGGATLGTFNLTPGRTGNQSAPSVAFEPCHDEFLVVWMDDHDGNWDVYGRTFDCAKTATCPLIPIATEASPQQYPDVDCAYGLAWVVWQDKRNGSLDVYGQMIDPGGILNGANVNVSQILPSEQAFPAIAMNPRPDTGCSLYSFLVAWRDQRNGTPDIYSHQVSDLGRCGPAADTSIYSGASTQTMPDVVYGTAPLEAGDRYLAVWQDSRMGSQDVFGRLVLPSNTPAGNSFPICNLAQDQRVPAVAFDGTDGQFLCVYEDWSTGNANIVGRRVSLGGALLGVALPFASQAASELAPAVAYSSSSDHYLAVWERASDIYARAYWN